MNFQEELKPKMKPIKSGPVLFTFYGCGFSIYGNRDHDPSSNSYVATHFLTLIFIPILALGAYRIAKTVEGKYFIGKERLSGVAKLWNSILALTILIGTSAIWHEHYTNSEPYIARQNMKTADKAVENKQIGSAAHYYKKVILSKTKYSREATDKLSDLLQLENLKQNQPDQVTQSIMETVRIYKRFPNYMDNALAMVEFYFDPEPLAAKNVLDAIKTKFPDKSRLADMEFHLLEKIVKIHPDDPKPASDLALLYEARKEIDKCENLLAPHASSLGTSEGARILGQIYAYQNRIKESYDLLLPYTSKKLELFHQAEKAYDDLLNQIWDQIIKELNNNQAPQAFYTAYNKADKARQDEMVQEYYTKRRDNTPEVNRRLLEYRRAAGIVPVAMDMGMVMLRRAQGLKDPAERRKELEAAKKTFLAVKGFAGQSDEYRLYLGQVHYWLGNHEEGKKLFEELLAAKKRSFDALYSISVILNEVGAKGESRRLALEGYKKATEKKDKDHMAHHLSILSTGLKEKISWLEKCDGSNVYVKASLYHYYGQDAQRLNHKNKAIKNYQKAINLHKSFPKTSTNLNNTALIYMDQYELSGDVKYFNQGLACLDEAISLNPDQSIILLNTIPVLIGSAVRDIIGGQLDLNLLKESGDIGLLRYLYNNQKQKDRLVGKFANHSGTGKALAYLEKAMLLAPKNNSVYEYKNSLFNLMKDKKALTSLADTLSNSSVDLTDRIDAVNKYISGENDAYYIESLENKLGELKRLKKRIDPVKQAKTYAVVISMIAETTIDLAKVKSGVDFDKLVAACEKNHKRLPSSATKSDLITALKLRVMETLSLTSPEIKEYQNKYQRSLGSNTLFVVLFDVEKFRKMFLKHKDVKRVLFLVKSNVEKYEYKSLEDWILLCHVSPALAGKISKSLKSNDLLKLNLKINGFLYPYSPHTAYQASWFQRINNNHGESKRILEAAKQQGILLL